MGVRGIAAWRYNCIVHYYQCGDEGVWSCRIDTERVLAGGWGDSVRKYDGIEKYNHRMKSKSRLFTCGGIFLLSVVAFLCLTLGLLAQFYGLDGPSRQNGESRAAPILSALQEYKNETGIYPADLTELVPTYLPSIPKPAWRWPYTYEYKIREGGKEFVLQFMLGRNMDGDYCGYSSQTNEWKCADSMPPY